MGTGFRHYSTSPCVGPTMGRTTKNGDEMNEDINSVSMLVRREIEALISVPILKAFIAEFGREKTLEVAEGVLKNQALDAGKFLVEVAGGNQLSDLEKILPLFSQGGALEFEQPEIGQDEIKLDITGCAFAEMYKRHGLEEFGYLLSCGRDFALFEGFNPELNFTRTQTIMEGADFCDFCFSSKK